VREIAGEAQQHGRALLGRQGVDALPHSVVTDLRTFRRGNLGQLSHRDGPALAGAEVVERLAVGDGQDPRARVTGPHPRVGAHRRQERLLKAVVGGVAAHGGDQEAPHVVAVSVEEALERLLRHRGTTPQATSS
jgi:hypothetical protein